MDIAKVSVAFKNGLWDEKNSSLMKEALKGAGSCDGTGMAAAGLLEFQNILQAKMARLVSSRILTHTLFYRCC